MSERGHQNRARAESFGADAAAYDQTRPSYPPALLDDLLAGAPGAVLDVGCGTGKASVLLAARGVRVLGIEIDDRMAQVARAYGIPVETASFENWDSRGRQFDLVICGQAWHWIDPIVGVTKVVGLLRPGGLFVPFWNFASLDDEAEARIDAAYRLTAPQLVRTSVMRGFGPSTLPGHISDLRMGFETVERRDYDWEQAYSRDEWLALIATHSDHRTLPAGQLAVLRREVGAAIDELGGALVARYRTTGLFARRA